MDEFRVRLLHIHRFGGISQKRMGAFLHLDSTLKSIYNLTVSDLSGMFKMEEKQAKAFHEHLHHGIDREEMLEQYDRQSISWITLFDPEYPALLKEIYDPPFVLYARGDRSLLTKGKWLSVVGTRYPSNEGRRITKQLVHTLSTAGWGIVSGLALGIDKEAHLSALGSKGKTIAVLGSGFHHLYPKENIPLANEMSETQLLLSEYPPDTKPQKWQFPMRNRIISGLSHGTLVIQAKEKSGSLITASQALEQNREVFAVPGSVFEQRFTGTNRLIQEGAKLVINADDILSELQG